VSRAERRPSWWDFIRATGMLIVLYSVAYSVSIATELKKIWRESATAEPPQPEADQHQQPPGRSGRT
jgi:hypothetical protein